MTPCWCCPSALGYGLLVRSVLDSIEYESRSWIADGVGDLGAAAQAPGVDPGAAVLLTNG